MNPTESVAGKRRLRRKIALVFAVTALPLVFAAHLRAAESDAPLGISSLLQKGLAELVELDVSLATGTSNPLKLAPSVASVITAADIEAMGAVTLDDVLESVPGIHVMRSSTNLLTSIWAIRGVYSQLDPQVLFLVNGQPVRSSTHGSIPHTFRMPVSMISRVEIIRGPGSAVLGADAFAGAVNVITKGAEEIGGSKAGLRAGSFDAMHVWAQHGGVYGGWEISLGAEYQKGDGDRNRIMASSVSAPGASAPVAPGPLDTHYEIADADLLIRNRAWSLRVYYNEAFDNGQGPGIIQTHTPESYVKYRWCSGSLAWQDKNVLPDLDATATLSGSYFRGDNYYQFYPSDVLNMIGNPGFQELNGGLELTGLYRGWADNRVRAVAGTTYFDTDTFQRKNYGPGVADQFGELVDITDTPYVYLTDQSRSLLYAALQDEWDFAKDWGLTVGARYDNYSDFGSAVSPRLALVWSVMPELTSKLLYGRAFRAPAFGEQHLQNNPATLGNAGLKPEKIDSVELAFDYRPVKSLRLGFNMFTFRIKDLIDYVPEPGESTPKTARNVHEQEGEGFEFEVDWLVADTVRLRANYAYQLARDSRTNDAVPDVPGQKVWADLDWGFLPQWSVNAQYVLVADRHRAAADARGDIADYDLVNVTLRRKNVVKNLDVALAVRNVFDADAREPGPAVVPADYPLEGRNFWAELRYAF
jgi:iron complex outermembrane receptor protein